MIPDYDIAILRQIQVLLDELERHVIHGLVVQLSVLQERCPNEETCYAQRGQLVCGLRRHHTDPHSFER